jgi:hypothetical protein
MALAAVLCGGCGSDTDIILECPSPGGMTVAILLARSGGGAAGWGDYELILQPATLPPTVPQTIGLGDSQEVFRADDVKAMTLDWESDEHLAVEWAFDQSTMVFAMSHRYPLLANTRPPIRINFSERAPSNNERADRRMTCRSAGRETTNPPIKRMAAD